jgi:DNA-binding SARP family transcriptional activator
VRDAQAREPAAGPKPVSASVRLLGPVGLDVDGRPCDLGPPKQRAVFAVLAVHAGQVVSTDRIIGEVWGDDAPESVISTLQVNVSRLRRSMGERGAGSRESPTRHGPRIVRRAPGYLLDLPDEAVDARRFARLLEAARVWLVDDPTAALRQLDEAMSLVTGSPLADVAAALGSTTGAEVARMQEMVLLAREIRLTALLALGDAAAVASAAATLVGEYPLREGLQSTLVLALYRGGRQAEALAAYERARRQLSDELGVDPGPALRRLHAQVLRHDPALDLAPTPASGPDRTSPTPQADRVGAGALLIGRTGPLAQLTSAVTRAARAAGSVWSVTGDAGIGKTVLCEELARVAVRTGAAVAWGRAHETAAQAPFWPWVQVLRALPEVPTDGAAGLVLGSATAGDAPSGSGRIHVYDEVGRLLVDRAGRGPLVLILEDLHWADEPTLELLAVVADRAGSSGLVVVCTHRAGHPPESPLGGLMAGFARLAHAERIVLDGLPDAEIGRLLDDRLGVTLAPGFVAETARRSDGNPFFAIELARLGAGSGAGAQQLTGPDEVPRTIRDVLLRRLSSLSGAARAVLDAAAVVGRDCDVSLLLELTGKQLDVLDVAIGEAVAAGLLGEHLQPRPGVRFAHALVRETLYTQLRPLARARLHAAAAVAMMRAPRPDVDELAFHAGEGAPVLGAQVALPVILDAVRRATERTAYEHAERLLDRAEELLACLPTGADRDGLELTLQVRRGTLSAVHDGWAAPATSAALGRAQVLAERAEPDADVFTALYGTIASLVVSGRFGEADTLAESFIERSGRPGLTGQRYELLGRWMRGTVAGQRGDVETCVHELRKAMVLADAVGGDLAQPVFHEPGVPIRAFLGSVLSMRGDEEGPVLAAAAARIAEQSADPFDQCVSELFLGVSAATRTDPVAAARFGGRTHALGEQHGFTFYALAGAQIEGWAAAVATDHGHPRDPRRLAGAALLRDSHKAYVAGGARTLGTLFLSLLSEAELAVGDSDAAVAAATQGLALSEENGERLWRDHLEHALRQAGARRDGDSGPTAR